MAAALARAHGAVHVAVPERRGLGAGPVDAIGGLADGAAVVEQDAGRGEADRAAARPDLLLPVGDVEGGRVGGLRAEVVAEVLQHVAAQIVARGAQALARRARLDEGHEDPGLARGRRVVEGDLRGRGVGHRLAGEAGGAPERLGVDGVDLQHGAHRHALGQLVAQRGQLRAVVDARRQRRRHGDDGALGGHAVAVGDRGHRAVLGDDPAHGPAQHDAVAEALGELDRHELRAADEAALLRAAAGVDQPLDVPRVRLVAGGGEVEEDEEQRDVTRLAREDRGDGDVEQETARGRQDVGELPCLEGLRIPLLGARRRPWRIERDRLGHVVELEDRLLGLDRTRGVGRHRAERARRAVAGGRPVAEVDVVAGVVGRERFDAHVLGQRGDTVLGGADELGAALGDDAVAQVDADHAPAHAVARLEHDDRPAGGDEVARGGSGRRARRR